MWVVWETTITTMGMRIQTATTGTTTGIIGMATTTTGTTIGTTIGVQTTTIDAPINKIPVTLILPILIH